MFYYAEEQKFTNIQLIMFNLYFFVQVLTIWVCDQWHTQFADRDFAPAVWTGENQLHCYRRYKLILGRGVKNHRVTFAINITMYLLCQQLVQIQGSEVKKCVFSRVCCIKSIQMLSMALLIANSIVWFPYVGIHRSKRGQQMTIRLMALMSCNMVI